MSTSQLPWGRPAEQGYAPANDSKKSAMARVQTSKADGRNEISGENRGGGDKDGGPGGFLFPTVLFVLACGILATIVFIAFVTIQAQTQSATQSNLSNMMKLTVSETLTLVSLLQGLLALSVTMLLTRSLHYLQWGLSARRQGMPYLEFLALSPMTLNWGSFLLIFGPSSSASARIWSGTRVVLFLLVWVSGIVLFFQTTLVAAYDTALTYDVTAGVGPFNATYIPEFTEFIKSTAPDYPFTIMPYSYYSIINNLVTNPILATVSEPLTCQKGDADCTSYLLSGGVFGAAPWIPAEHAEYPLVWLKHVPAIQVDFKGKHGPKDFDESDCRVLGSEIDLIGAELCVRAEGSNKMHAGESFPPAAGPSVVINFDYPEAAGLFICTEGMLDGQCITTTPAPNLTTTLAFHRRQVDLLVSKHNYTIISTAGMSTPTPAPVEDMQAYRQVLTWLLDYNASNVPAPSSIIELFWTAQEQLQSPTTDVFLSQTFNNMLTFPLWMFNANNYGNLDLQVRDISPNLPPEFYTEASLVQQHLKLKFDPVVLTVFAVSHVILLIFSAVALVWAICRGKTLPSISSFPVFDVYFKPHVIVADPAEYIDVWRAQDLEVIKLMKNATVTRRLTALQSG